jgi:tRNA nucleotidyltransferase (CCA-adding enzyme)
LRLEECWPPDAVAVTHLVGRLSEQVGTPAYLVGGPVRDLLLGRPTLDLDIAVEGPVGALAEALAAELGAAITRHELFGTATLRWDSPFHLDLARTRTETYAEPGALPEVEPAALGDDLYRRDFTIHAMALPLDGGPREVVDPFGGRLDLRLGLLRGLHPRTFADDPTRLLRAARYAATHDLEVERETLAWLTTAVADRALATVSGSRIWGEFSRLLAADSFVTACDLLEAWGALAALGLRHSPAPLGTLDQARTALGVGDASDRVLAALGILAGPRAAELAEDYALHARERTAVAEAALAVTGAPAPLFAAETKNSTLYGVLRDLSPAAWLALWACHPAARPVLQAQARWREWRPDVTGDDLEAAGFVPGPGFQPALQAALAAHLDEGADREQQLQAALAVMRRGQPS